MTHGQQTNNESSGRKTRLVRSVETMQIAPFPPLNLKTKFKTVHRWLSHICTYDKPDKAIVNFKLGLVESQENGYTLYLIGEDSYDERTDCASTRVVYPTLFIQTKNTKAQYKDLTHEQLLDKLTLQLKSFTDTGDFKASFLAEADSIVFITNGQTIWTKNG